MKCFFSSTLVSKFSENEISLLGIHTVRDSIMQQIGPIFFTLILSDFWAIRNQHKDLITENHHLSTTDTTILMENCQILPWNEENLDWQIDCCSRVHTVFLISTLFYTFLFKNSLSTNFLKSRTTKNFFSLMRAINSSSPKNPPGWR